jgi:hypothetical protein
LAEVAFFAAAFLAGADLAVAGFAGAFFAAVFLAVLAELEDTNYLSVGHSGASQDFTWARQGP